MRNCQKHVCARLLKISYAHSSRSYPLDTPLLNDMVFTLTSVSPNQTFSFWHPSKYHVQNCPNTCPHIQRASLLGTRTLLGAPGIATRSKKLLGAKGIATRNMSFFLSPHLHPTSPGWHRQGDFQLGGTGWKGPDSALSTTPARRDS